MMTQLITIVVSMSNGRSISVARESERIQLGYRASHGAHSMVISLTPEEFEVLMAALEHTMAYSVRPPETNSANEHDYQDVDNDDDTDD